MYILSILALVLYQHYTAGKCSSTSLKIPILFSHFIYFLIFFLIVFENCFSELICMISVTVLLSHSTKSNIFRKCI